MIIMCRKQMACLQMDLPNLSRTSRMEHEINFKRSTADLKSELSDEG